MKKILVTGPNGYVGKAFIEAYGKKDSLRLFGRTPIDGYDFVVGDVKNLDECVGAACGVDIILHMAAATTSKKGVSDRDYIETNIVGTLNILEAAARNKVNKVVYCSSVCAVGFRATPKLIMETDAPDPSDGIYGYSKYIGEKLCEGYSEKYGINIICLRLGMVFPLHEFHVPLNMLNRYWLGSVHVDDVLEAIRLSIDDDKIRFDVFHVASGSPHSKFDISKARNILGYNPKNKLEEYIHSKAFKAGFFTRILARLRYLLQLKD